MITWIMDRCPATTDIPKIVELLKAQATKEHGKKALAVILVSCDVVYIHIDVSSVQIAPVNYT